MSEFYVIPTIDAFKVEITPQIYSDKVIYMLILLASKPTFYF